MASASAGAEPANKGAIITGATVGPDSWFSYAGTVVGMGTTLDKSGFLARAMIGYGQFEYESSGVAGGHVEGTTKKVEIGPGYQLVLPSVVLSTYAGLDYVGTGLSPDDPRNSTSGNKWGVFGQGELATTAAVPIFVGLIGKYSTANDAYWTRARAGGRLQGIVVGPEFIAAGNQEYDEKRVGGFVSGIKIASFSLDLSAGYAWSEARDESGRGSEKGAYGGVSLFVPF